MSDTLSLDDPTGILSLAVYMAELRLLATARWQQKNKFKSHLFLTKGYPPDLPGLMAEQAFEILTGRRFNRELLVAGDGGVDFRLENGETIDVKGTQFWSDPDVIEFPNPKHWKDYYVLVAVDVHAKLARYCGYATKSELQGGKLKDYGYGNRLSLSHLQLHSEMPAAWVLTTTVQY